MKNLFIRIRGRFRLFWGFCPECNSDAPKLYECPVCDWNRTHKSHWWHFFKLEHHLK